MFIKHCLTLILLSIFQSTYAQYLKPVLRTHVLNDSMTILDLNDTTHYIFKIEADYCNYCHVMNRITYQNSEVIDRINAHSEFYSINLKFRESLYVNKQKMVYLDQLGVHGLVVFLSKNQLDLPITVFYHLGKKRHWVYNGYLLPEEYLEILAKFYAN